MEINKNKSILRDISLLLSELNNKFLELSKEEEEVVVEQVLKDSSYSITDDLTKEEVDEQVLKDSSYSMTDDLTREEPQGRMISFGTDGKVLKSIPENEKPDSDDILDDLLNN